MTLTELRRCGVGGTHPDGWTYSATIDYVTRPLGASLFAEPPEEGWDLNLSTIGGKGLKPW